MIASNLINATVRQYREHGWILRRIVLEKAEAADIGGDFEVDVEVGSAVNGLWFSRPPEPGGQMWELRYLGPRQFALVERMDENESDFSTRMRSIERRLAAIVGVRELT